jgi:hypothetical protein
MLSTVLVLRHTANEMLAALPDFSNPGNGGHISHLQRKWTSGYQEELKW